MVLSLIRQHIQAYTICIEAQNGLDLLQQLNRTTPAPDIAIIDVEMPVIDGVAVTNIIKTVYPKIKTVAISVHAHPPAVLSMLKAGANGYLLKESLKPKTLLKAFAAIEHNNHFVDESLENIQTLLPEVTVEEPLPTDSAISSLTPKEKFFLQLAATGISYEEIAELMNIGKETVYSYPKKLKEKLGLNSRQDFTVYALQYGIAKIARLKD